MDISGELLLIVSSFIFSTMGIFTRELGKELSPVTQVAYRLVFVSMIYLIFFSLKDRKFLKINRVQLRDLFIAGFFGYGLMVVFIALSYLNTDYASASTFVQSSAIFVILLSAMILKEDVKGSTIVAVILSMIGVIVMFRPNLSNFDKGAGYALLSALFYSGYIILIRKHKDLDIRTRLFYTAFFAGFPLLPFVFLFESPVVFVMSKQTWFFLFVMVVLNIIGYFLMNLGLKKVQANLAGVLNVTQAIFGIAISYIVYNEIFTSIEMLGATLILSSIVLINVKK